MDSSGSLFSLLITILLFSSFIKFTTVLSLFRYGAGLVGLEFGVVCLVAAFGLALVTLPPEVRDGGLPPLLGTSASQPRGESITKDLAPKMARSLDEAVVKGLFGEEAARDPQQLAGDISKLLPSYLFSELKRALTVGVLLLIPFVLVDLIVAHLISLIGLRQLPVQVVSMPLKIVLFLAIDGWALLGAKLLAGEGV